MISNRSPQRPTFQMLQLCLSTSKLSRYKIVLTSMAPSESFVMVEKFELPTNCTKSTAEDSLYTPHGDSAQLCLAPIVNTTGAPKSSQSCLLPLPVTDLKSVCCL